MSGVIVDVNRNRNAACPFGVAIEDTFVPVLIVIESALSCSCEIIPWFAAATASEM